MPDGTVAGSHVYRVGRVPRNLWPMGDRLESRFGKLGKEYKQIASQPFSRVIAGSVVDVNGEEHDLHMLSFRGASSKLAEWQSQARARLA